MSGRRALSAHGARRLIVKTDDRLKLKKTRLQNCWYNILGLGLHELLKAEHLARAVIARKATIDP